MRFAPSLYPTTFAREKSEGPANIVGSRKSGRAAYCGCLENSSRCEPTVGSNPTSSVFFLCSADSRRAFLIELMTLQMGRFSVLGEEPIQR